MAMYRLDVMDISAPEGLQRWKPDSYWDNREEAVDFLEDPRIEEDTWNLYRLVEVFGEVIF